MGAKNYVIAKKMYAGLHNMKDQINLHLLCSVRYYHQNYRNL